MRTLLFAHLVLLICAIAGPAQSGNGEIRGNVEDRNGDAIVGALVKVTRSSLRFEQTVLTDNNGAFAASGLLPGNYDVTVTSLGFADQRRTVNVAFGAVTNLSFRLSIGESRFTVSAEVGSRQDRAFVPQAVTIISREKLLERSTSVVAQVAKEEVGLNVQRTSPTIGAIVVRGLTGKNVVNYVDGVRYTNGAQRGGINTFFDLNDVSNLQSIEVLRGPNGAQYGSDSLGGTVNLLTRSPEFGSDRAIFHGELVPTFSSADRSFGSSAYLSYGTNKLGGYVNLFGRRVNTLRTAGGIDTHSSITRFLGLPSTILYDRNPDTAFTQYGGAARLDYSPVKDGHLSFYYQRGQQDGGKRFDQLVGGDGNLIADLRNLMLDFGYLRFVKQNFGWFDAASFTASYNSQREERVNQGGQGNPAGDITHQYERTSTYGFSTFFDKMLPGRNTFLVGGDYYAEKIDSPAFIVNPVSNVSTISRPRVPDGATFDSAGVFVQDAWQAIPERLRITGALRYSGMWYRTRATDSPIVGGNRLWGDDELSVADWSGRVGFVVGITRDLRAAFNYGRGFRYPSMTDLGTLGLTGDGFEVDHVAATALGGTIGSTAGANAVNTGIPVEKQRSEFSNSYDISLRYADRRFDTELTVFRLDLDDSIVKQALILPAGSVGQSLGGQTITSQLPNGVVFVPLSSAPVLVRTNFSDARIWGIEYEAEGRISSNWSARGNFTYSHAADKLTGAPPNIEGGTPPATGFLSLKYTRSRFWVEGYSTLAAKQDRLSSLDLSDRRTGAPRSQAQIENFFRRGACVRGLTANAAGTCGAAASTYTLLATGENISQVLTRVLGPGFTSSNLFNSLPGYALFNVRGGINFGEKTAVFFAFENIFDRQHRNPSWGIDGAGRNFTTQVRYRF